MELNISKKALFNASCIALTVTAMTFAIRAGILTELGVDFGLNNTQLGWINAMAFWGFPVATIFGGLLYNYFGPKKLLVAAFLSHLIGLIMTIYADGFTTLLLSSFLIGFGLGMSEEDKNVLGEFDEWLQVKEGKSFSLHWSKYILIELCDGDEKKAINTTLELLEEFVNE